MKQRIKHAIIAFILLITAIKTMHIPTPIDRNIGQIPVMHDGRVKPFDTVARHYLLQINGKLSVKNQSPSEWLMTLLTHPTASANDPIILVEHPRLFDAINPLYNKQKFRVSEAFLDAHIEKLSPFMTEALQYEKAERTPFLQATYLVFYRYQLIKRLRQSYFPSINHSQLDFWNTMLQITQSFDDDISTDSEAFQTFSSYYATLTTFNEQSDPLLLTTIHNTWLSLPELALSTSITAKEPLSIALLLSDAFQKNDHVKIRQYSQQLTAQTISQLSLLTRMQVQIEYWFNAVNPFIMSLFLYLIVIILCVFHSNSVVSFHTAIRFGWASALTVHGVGLLARSFILMRPPVINLYSSAIFISFVASVIGFIMHKRTNESVYAISTTVLSGLSLIVAYHLSLSGDTLEVMEAVLNSNFWLSTHVVAMTIGYAIIFMAGFFAIAYILMGTLTKRLSPSIDNTLCNVVYIFLMIALFFNVLGTVLGGIWADQSWGRFWGWDPKENGAILIVLWTAIILHMKWGKLISPQALMVMTVLSNIVTAWSWKGTNMLGIGLHSYGFTEQTFYWLILFFASQLIIAALGLIPRRYWSSNQAFNDPN